MAPTDGKADRTEDKLFTEVCHQRPKTFTSAIQNVDYVWLAARTYPEAPKHKGQSIFILPVDSSGVS